MNRKTLAYLSLIALIASLSPAAHAQTFSTIYSFSGPDGGFPFSGVTIRAGVLYGTAPCLQECEGLGAVYQMSHVGSSWAHTTIALLSGSYARPVFGPDNHLYGTARMGGPQSDGAVFSLTPQASICKTANCFWTQKPLYQFSGSPDGQNPGTGDLIWDSTGNIYGTTTYGGPSNLGTVYEMTKSGNSWTETPIYKFTGPDGTNPWAGVIFDGNGNLFGTTASGGRYGYGNVFELTYSEGIGWTESVLYNFQNLSDGGVPTAGLVMDAAGNLFGATTNGGNGGGGTAFELSPMGNSWGFTLLYSFSGPQDMECGPWGTPALDDSGNLYGTTYCDGANGFGNIFKLTNTQNGWAYTSLHDFTGGTDGGYSASNVTIDTDGTLYGTASAFGGNDHGTVWMIKP